MRYAGVWLGNGAVASSKVAGRQRFRRGAGSGSRNHQRSKQQDSCALKSQAAIHIHLIEVMIDGPETGLGWAGVVEVDSEPRGSACDCWGTLRPNSTALPAQTSTVMTCTGPALGLSLPYSTTGQPAASGRSLGGLFQVLYIAPPTVAKGSR